MFDISVKQVGAESVSRLQAEVDFSHLSAGVYIVNVSLENGGYGTFRVIKE